jgi:hypothetical protein
MIVLVAASAVFLTASQAVINGPRDAFKSCLKAAGSKASSEKVTPDGFEAYVRSTCGSQLGAFKSAVVKFDMSNKMSRNASDEDANMMIADFVGSALETYKYRNRGSSDATKEASSPPPSAPAVTPPPTPASAPQPPK